VPLQEVEVPQLQLVDMAGLFMMLGCAIVILGIVKLARQRLCPHVSLKDPQMALETGVILTMEQQFELLSRKLDGVEAIKEQLEAQGQQLDVLTGQVAAIRSGLHQDEIRVDNSTPQASSSDGGVHVDSEFRGAIAIEVPCQAPHLFAPCKPQPESTGRAGLCC